MAAAWRRCTEHRELYKSLTSAPRHALPWLPYEGLFPEMLAFPHPTNLLLMPVHVLGHQDLRAKHTRQGGRRHECIYIYERAGATRTKTTQWNTAPLLSGWCRMRLLLLLLWQWRLCPGTSPEEDETNRIRSPHHVQNSNQIRLRWNKIKFDLQDSATNSKVSWKCLFIRATEI